MREMWAKIRGPNGLTLQFRTAAQGARNLTLASAAAQGSGYDVVIDGLPKHYQLLDKARHAWRICVLLPHGKDTYWWGVSWGADEQAKQLGVQIGIYQAGGYEYLETQRQQWLECRRQRADAYVLGAIQATGLRAEIDQALAENKPVIDLVNGVEGRVTSRQPSCSPSSQGRNHDLGVVSRAGRCPLGARRGRRPAWRAARQTCALA
jgi:ABC-type sugar transport system substrate-binding protein